MITTLQRNKKILFFFLIIFKKKKEQKNALYYVAHMSNILKLLVEIFGTINRDRSPHVQHSQAPC